MAMGVFSIHRSTCRDLLFIRPFWPQKSFQKSYIQRRPIGLLYMGDLVNLVEVFNPKKNPRRSSIQGQRPSKQIEPLLQVFNPKKILRVSSIHRRICNVLQSMENVVEVLNIQKTFQTYLIHRIHSAGLQSIDGNVEVFNPQKTFQKSSIHRCSIHGRPCRSFPTIGDYQKSSTYRSLGRDLKF